MGFSLDNMYWFLSGAIMLGCFVASLFFCKFWKKTRDRLFLFFGVAFAILSVERLVLVLMSERSGESNAAIYLMRLSAFALIIISIVDKNRQESS